LEFLDGCKCHLLLRILSVIERAANGGLHLRPTEKGISIKR
jgi:hypothetical protein